MRKFKLGYTTVAGNQKYLDCLIDSETGKIANVDGSESFIVATAPATAKFIEIINTAQDTKVVIESAYDRLNPHSRESVMQSPVTLTIKTNIFQNHTMQVGKLEPIFTPSIGVALVFLDPSPMAEDQQQQAYNYNASLLGFVNLVDATVKEVQTEVAEAENTSFPG